MKGLNIVIDIYERAQEADDAVGGSVRIDNLRYGNVRARISNPRQSRLLLEQGFEARHIHDVIIYPAAPYTGAQEEDIVVPQNGALADARLRVKGVHLMSLRPNTPRSHIQLRCERMRYAHENTPEVADPSQPYDPAVTLTNDINAVVNSLNYTSTGDPISVSDVLLIDSERMLVAIVLPAGNVVFVIRGWNSIAASHTAGTAIRQIP